MKKTKKPKKNERKKNAKTTQKKNVLTPFHLPLITLPHNIYRLQLTTIISPLTTGDHLSYIIKHWNFSHPYRKI